MRWQLFGLMAIGMMLGIDASLRGGASEPPRPLRVLVWNVLHAGNDVDRGPEKALRIIRSTKADVVLLQESYDIDGERPKLGRWLADQLGWNEYQGESNHLCVLTRLAIEVEFFHDPWHGIGARLKDDQERAFIAYSIWLDYRSYITWDLRDRPEIDDAELLAAEDVRSSRLPQVRALLQHLEDEQHLAADVPLLVGGDFNTPSHLDWTLDTSRVYRHRRDLPLPVSRAMAAAGFGDTFRLVHPNPVQHPGITWSPMFRSSGDKDQGFERIDRLYVHNPEGRPGLRPVSARVLPEVWEDESIPTRQRAFPSDHGAVIVELMWDAD